ncbi:DgyrCDS4330 [Dimorphilus gyrociliatus]|uniref:DgyrCDS4330 n=1 Tax=Dimorphilus gyrociliatus TaxID=2664684 RepID=A0A7I8VI61_9ANNE|nr:DgyrCDS4330 [Dimorphilus gyrociliatus]
METDTNVSKILTRRSRRNTGKCVNYFPYEKDSGTQKDKVLSPPAKKRKHKKSANNQKDNYGVSENSVVNNNNTIDTDVRIATLLNHGHTCYANCVLQVLRYTPLFVKYARKLWTKITIVCYELTKQGLLANDVSLKPWVFLKHLINFIEEMIQTEEESSPDCSSHYDSRGERKRSHPLVCCPHVLFSITSQLFPGFAEINTDQDAREFLDFTLERFQESHEILQSLLLHDGPNRRQNIQDSLQNHIHRVTFSEEAITENDKDPCFHCKMPRNNMTELVKSTLMNFGKEVSDDFKTENIADIRKRFEIRKCEDWVCDSCHNTIKRPTTIFELSIIFPPDDSDVKSLSLNDIIKRSSDNQELESLAQKWLLGRARSKREKVDDYNCGKCGSKNMWRNDRYVSLPPILVVYLTRFKQNDKGDWVKIRKLRPTPFRLPCLLDSCGACTDPLHIYELYAVIIHTGDSIDSGHFTAVVDATLSPHAHRDGWLKLDDMKVEVKEVDKFINSDLSGRFSKTPYMLFYRRLGDC